jgi:hypothetical protein
MSVALEDQGLIVPIPFAAYLINQHLIERNVQILRIQKLLEVESLEASLKVFHGGKQREQEQLTVLALLEGLRISGEKLEAKSYLKATSLTTTETRIMGGFL